MTTKTHMGQTSQKWNNFYQKWNKFYQKWNKFYQKWNKNQKNQTTENPSPPFFFKTEYREQFLIFF